MSKKELKIYYKNKINLLKKYDKYYYDKSNPIVSDLEYDELKREVLNLESSNNFLISKASPSINVGHKPSKNFKKIFHRAPNSAGKRYCSSTGIHDTSLLATYSARPRPNNI